MRPLKNRCEIAVIGGGLAGLSAARHAARLGRSVTLFEDSGIFGGQVATVGELDGLPFPGKHGGQDLAIDLLEGSRKVGVQVIESRIQQVQLGQFPELGDRDNMKYFPGALIVASGASPRKLEAPGEIELTGRGVSRCASCDGGFFRGENVVVVGGGDGAVHEALELAKTSRKVIMVCRSPLRAKREYIDRLAAKENVAFVWDSEVLEILGDDSVSGVRIRNVQDNHQTDIECAAVFPFIGGRPNSDFLPSALLMATGHVIVNHDFSTRDSRVFAVGAVRDNFGGNAVQALAEGVSAAESAARAIDSVRE